MLLLLSIPAQIIMRHRESRLKKFEAQAQRRRRTINISIQIKAKAYEIYEKDNKTILYNPIWEQTCRCSPVWEQIFEKCIPGLGALL